MPQVGEFVGIAKGLYLEGLAVDYARDVIWYSDVIAGGIHGVKPDGTRVATLNPDRMWTGGVMMNEDGCVLSSGQGGIMWNNPDTGQSGWLVSEIAGAPINGINEMIPDGTGGIYCGTVDIEMIAQGKETRPATIYRIKADGEVLVAAAEVGFANGIMLSADGKELYYNNTFVSPFVFDVNANHELSNRRKLIDKEDCDGMALDAEDNLWITGFRSSALTRIRRDGTPLDPVETPAGAITQIRFGGADMCDYYLTAVPADGGDGLKDGIMPTEQRSVLYRGRSEVPGLPIAPARFKLR
ncbi:SMP-30/gluconolactonase/LRE family protein [Novosphingobium sp. G106]|uniref:SMP-30/gluconolactonase/LRE family protein n=1 Tax=Novosphingobium sp. G106 TaxID=2849500 RepID=UPI001C2CEFD2|nr:SMP-30/gluconolactonase/LRE family protein [Novosphingobium sp. G106]MBV1690555.1 SMP-30/gluconolactonase/LRE family protein [Novosphingobium sp. G106]